MSHSRGIFFRSVTLVAAFFILLCCIIAACGFGAVHIPPLKVIELISDALKGSKADQDYPPSWVTILFNIRLPRVILGCLVGMTLGIAGVVFQALFRNPLADPYLIGVSSGASFGATIAIYFVFHFSWGGFNAVSIFAFCGALLTMFAIYGLSHTGRRTPVTILILAGVALGSLLSAATTFLLFTAKDAYQTIHALGWLFGDLSAARWSEIIGILPYLAAGFIVIGLYSYRLNVLQLDEQQAKSLGINVERTKLILLIMTTLPTAAAVSVSGVIGFVGLIVPHIVRLAWGPDHRFLVPMSGIIGAIIIIMSDSLARSIFAPREIPLGVITALLGAPFFLYLLRRQKKDIM